MTFDQKLQHFDRILEWRSRSKWSIWRQIWISNFKFSFHVKQVEEMYTERWSVHSYDEDGDSIVSSLRLPPEWLLRNGLHFGRHEVDMVSGHRFIELNLTCISRLYGLYEDSDFVSFRLRKPSPPAPVKMADDPAPGAKISSSPAANVLHDALRNSAAGISLSKCRKFYISN